MNLSNIDFTPDESQEIEIAEQQEDFMNDTEEIFMEGFRSRDDRLPSQVARDNDKNRYYE